MSEFEHRSYHQAGPATSPAQQSESAPLPSPGRNVSQRNSPSRKVALKLLPWVLGLVILGTVVGYFATSGSKNGKTGLGAMRGSSDGSTGTNLAKPSAGKPFTQAPPTPPPVIVPRSSPPAIPPQSSSTLVIPPGPAIPQQSSATPVPPVTPGTPPPPAATPAPFAPVVYPARHDKHFGEGCSGQLSLNSTGLAFGCPDDPHGGVQAAINDIAAVDENGIRLTSGKKYHFSIPGMSKGSEQQLFTDWWNHVH